MNAGHKKYVFNYYASKLDTEIYFNLTLVRINAFGPVLCTACKQHEHEMNVQMRQKINI